jgi:hypothetical protein
MRRADAKRWAATTTLTDLCALTVEWLEGRLASQPGYAGPCDVDQAPCLRAALVALNQIGFLTNDSQEGFEGEGADGAQWTQRAAVFGFTDRATFDWLTNVLPGFEVTTATPHGTVVTWRNGEPHTVYGARWDAGDLSEEAYPGCSEEALASVADALQVTVYDPMPRSNQLWEFLQDSAAARLKEIGAKRA